MPFLPANQQHQSTEGSSKQNLLVCNKLLHSNFGRRWIRFRQLSGQQSKALLDSFELYLSDYSSLRYAVSVLYERIKECRKWSNRWHLKSLVVILVTDIIVVSVLLVWPYTAVCCSALSWLGRCMCRMMCDIQNFDLRWGLTPSQLAGLVESPLISDISDCLAAKPVATGQVLTAVDAVLWLTHGVNVCAAPRPAVDVRQQSPWLPGRAARRSAQPERRCSRPVSYTHLTLPTILRV